MINTKKTISEFFAKYDQIEKTIRSRTVYFKKRKIKICHDDMIDLNLQEVDPNDLIFIAIKHLQDNDFEFDKLGSENHLRVRVAAGRLEWHRITCESAW